MTQPISVLTDPNDASIEEIQDGERRPIGHGDVTRSVEYAQQVLHFDPMCWLGAFAGGLSALTGGGMDAFAKSDRGRAGGLVFLALGLGVLGTSLGACFAGMQLDGRVVSAPVEWSVSASKPGYVEQVVTVSLPVPSGKLHFRLQPLANASMAAVSAASAPAEGRVVVVFDLEDRAELLEGTERDQLTEYLGAALTSTQRFRVLPRDIVRARLVHDKARSFQACYDAACQIELGKALAAQESLSTRLFPAGDACVLTGVLYDLKTEVTSRATTVQTACDGRTLLAGLTALANRLAEK
jgi:hypothetical protein